MRAVIVWLVFGLSMSGSAVAQTGPDDPFDASVLSFEELRVVQAGLVFSGWYQGLLDGEWGEGSQAALESYSVRRFDTSTPLWNHLVPLIGDFQAEWRDQNWQMKYVSQTGTSFALPRDLLQPSDNADELAWLSADGSLSATMEIGTRDETKTQHALVYSRRADDAEPYQDETPDRIVTAVTLPDGSTAYLRSDKIKGRFVTLFLSGEPEQYARLSLMASSITKGSMPGLKVPEKGVLAALENQDVAAVEPDRAPEPGLVPGTQDDAGIEGLGRLGRGRQEEPEAGQVPPTRSSPGARLDPDAPRAKPRRKALSPDDATGTGSGFFVNASTIVTAAHVVEGCSAVSLLDGSPLEVTAQDDGLDLAVLITAGTSATWLNISAEVRPRLGETVYALGYPYLGLLDQGLAVTGGNVSALGGVDPSEARIMVSAPVQPGNSGGPLINARGEVIGVVVSRIDDMSIFDQTGTLPQNMNFAVPPEPLVGFLDDALVDFPATERAEVDIARGLPDEIRDAVVPLFCY